MTDYNALKVPDLKAMLGQRKLLQTGNKQALIARLQEDDEKNDGGADEAKPGEYIQALPFDCTRSKAEQHPALRVTSKLNDVLLDAAKEDEINYSDDEATASKPAPEEPAPAATESKPEDAPKVDDAAPTEGDADAEKTEPAEPAVSYAMGLASTAAEAEAKKRADRAKRFGIEEDDDSVRRADRAKRFGLDQKELASSLDSALPERPLKRGRGRGGDADSSRPGKRQSLDRRGGRHGRGPRQGGNRERGGPAVLDATEKAKAEKRAARFASA